MTKEDHMGKDSWRRMEVVNHLHILGHLLENHPHILDHLGPILMMLKESQWMDTTIALPPEPFSRAVKEGDYKSVKLFLNAGVSANPYTLDGLWMLHLAVQYGQINIAELLLQYGADPNLEAWVTKPRRSELMKGLTDSDGEFLSSSEWELWGRYEYDHRERYWRLNENEGQHYATALDLLCHGPRSAHKRMGRLLLEADSRYTCLKLFVLSWIWTRSYNKPILTPAFREAIDLSDAPVERVEKRRKVVNPFLALPGEEGDLMESPGTDDSAGHIQLHMEVRWALRAKLLGNVKFLLQWRRLNFDAGLLSKCRQMMWEADERDMRIMKRYMEVLLLMEKAMKWK
ncbi:hypothetical protein BO70DRAFT_428430 [Aspergillus heteromorphus CBS 117.55]|uniref:Uncharacterized protein n=1 Tax=Aspergillus heteromorphus CBS 117.55 TaxID=1448321 RepID=A0A317WEX9_9EURO|nr:uncharacterized protein BO70DRAFT_428430 [Aspergillus heteromorphus CBS 117.55]PWY84829.1 hypothetical protein BO70DRAFT_428430 [Aspergillus heteromorphus CBS 117.55]